jgi:hypothetical protein
MIARANGSLLFEKWNGPVTMGDGIVCEPNDVAVVAQWGAVKGTLPPGQHGVPMPDVEIFFVRTVPRRSNPPSKACGYDLPGLRSVIGWHAWRRD